MVWIYGGGLYNGSTADPQYDLSGIVRTSQNGGSPIVGVSINYRLGVWGFLQPLKSSLKDPAMPVSWTSVWRFVGSRRTLLPSGEMPAA